MESCDIHNSRHDLILKVASENGEDFGGTDACLGSVDTINNSYYLPSKEPVGIRISVTRSIGSRFWSETCRSNSSRET
jgi:hypothetical protein